MKAQVVSARPRRPRGRRLLLPAVAILVAIGLIEAAGRAMLRPSNQSFGTLFGRELPPLRPLVSGQPNPLPDPSRPFGDMKDGGAPLTWGDLWGVSKMDAAIGYVNAENFTSRNRWWISNNLGARSDRDASVDVPPGQTRVLIFGESYGNGSRVRQAEAWPTVLGSNRSDLDVLNFAIDGYSMAQALLHYRQIRQRCRFNVAMLMFVPEADLWRDVNVFRQLYDPSWESVLIPRFAVSRDGLQLVPPFYANPLDLYAENGGGLREDFRAHLRLYDRYYFPEAFDEPHGLAGSIWWRLVSRATHLRKRRELEEGLMSPASEAVRVTQKIAATMREEVEADGGRFVLAILPVKPLWWNGTSRDADRRQWQGVVDAVCANQPDCLDLLPVLGGLPLSAVDRVYDGEHFGPGMNRQIADAVSRRLAASPAVDGRR